MQVSVYHRTVPNAKSQEKVDVLRFFAEGVVKNNDSAINVDDHSYRAADVAVIQGWIANNTASQHLQLRNGVIQKQLQKRRYVVAIDSNLFLYSTPGNSDHYLRYSFNGVFPNTGIYCDDRVDPMRWNKISQRLGLSLKPYRSSGDHILLALQRNGGWSMDRYHVVDWTAQTILEIRKHTDRPIVIRAHPGDKTAKDYIGSFDAINELKNVRLSAAGSTLLDDLRNCWAVVNHNSSPAVGAAIEGYPIFVTDPDKSQCRDVANTDLSKIENPNMPDRQAWAQRISMFHWNFEELRSGECWAHMRQWVR